MQIRAKDKQNKRSFNEKQKREEQKGETYTKTQDIKQANKKPNNTKNNLTSIVTLKYLQHCYNNKIWQEKKNTGPLVVNLQSMFVYYLIKML